MFHTLSEHSLSTRMTSNWLMPVVTIDTIATEGIHFSGSDLVVIFLSAKGVLKLQVTTNGGFFQKTALKIHNRTYSLIRHPSSLVSKATV